MSKFSTVRHPITITVGDQSHDFFVRELGYLEYQEIRRRTKSDQDKEQSGLALMTAVVLACVEESDESLSYTPEQWHREVSHVVMELGKAAMKAQGIDLDKIKEEAPMSEEEAEGNALPSRMSGAN